MTNFVMRTSGPVDKDGRQQFELEWDAKTPRCRTCGLQPGEGYPVLCGDGPACAESAEPTTASE